MEIFGIIMGIVGLCIMSFIAGFAFAAHAGSMLDQMERIQLKEKRLKAAKF